MENLKYALIAGGTGSVGEGIVKALLANDWKVVVPGRTKTGLDNLASYCDNHPNLFLHQANISKFNESTNFFSLCKSTYPALQLFVASLGGWRQGTTLLELSWEEWQATIEDNLSSHFLAMKLGYSLLGNDGTFIHINGMGADAVIPTVGPTVAAAAFQMRLALTLAEEQKMDSRKVYEVVLGLVNTRSRSITGLEGEQLINPTLVAQYILLLHNRTHSFNKEVKHILPDAGAVKKYLEPEINEKPLA
jgi:3-oxoacyl-[acyl-carrier protein] reductase